MSIAFKKSALPSPVEAHPTILLRQAPFLDSRGGQGIVLINLR